jgi:hypothetical protein
MLAISDNEAASAKVPLMDRSMPYTRLTGPPLVRPAVIAL